jgi:light-independent protochlorophyllide reductase subunit B
MGAEGANVLFDTWVHPLMMGLEEHLLGMFREDFEFHGNAGPSHLASAASAAPAPTVGADPSVSSSSKASVSSIPHTDGAAPPGPAADSDAGGAAVLDAPVWAADAERELHKIPFFVRGKARRNTERYATERGVSTITIETLYDAKAHFSR